MKPQQRDIADLDEDFWEDLLAFIEEGKVIPVIGQGVVTFGEDDQPLYLWLANRLAERLSIAPNEMEQPPVSTVLPQPFTCGERISLTCCILAFFVS